MEMALIRKKNKIKVFLYSAEYFNLLFSCYHEQMYIHVLYTYILISFKTFSNFRSLSVELNGIILPLRDHYKIPVRTFGRWCGNRELQL